MTSKEQVKLSEGPNRAGTCKPCREVCVLSWRDEKPLDSYEQCFSKTVLVSMWMARVKESQLCICRLRRLDGLVLDGHFTK